MRVWGNISTLTTILLPTGASPHHDITRTSFPPIPHINPWIGLSLALLILRAKLQWQRFQFIRRFRPVSGLSCSQTLLLNSFTFELIYAYIYKYLGFRTILYHSILMTGVLTVPTVPIPLNSLSIKQNVIEIKLILVIGVGIDLSLAKLTIKSKIYSTNLIVKHNVWQEYEWESDL